MEIWEYGMTRGSNGRWQFRQCEAVNVVARPRRYGLTGSSDNVNVTRCQADAMRGVSWVGIVSGDTHSMLVCDRHTLLWLGPMVGEDKEAVR